MNPIYDRYEQEHLIIVPKYVIKIANQRTKSNEIRLFYSYDTLMAEILSLWNNYEFVVQ